MYATIVTPKALLDFSKVNILMVASLRGSKREFFYS